VKLPEAFVEKYTQLLGDEAPDFLASFDLPAHSGYRVNPLRPDAVRAANPGDARINYSPNGYVGKVDGNGIAHVSGYVYSQEPSAQLVGAVADAQPGMRVLDLCAAPGGKSTYLAGAMANQGVLVSNEINLGRARILASNIERWGARNVIVTNNDPASLAKALPEFFDLILVDAPCSGEGMFRKDPDAVQYWDSDYPARCADRQREIVTEAVKMLAPGGSLVYSTCTFAPEEDEQMVSWMLANTELQVTPITKLAGMSDARPEWGNGDPNIAGAVRLWPHKQLGEGHFVARLHLPATTAAAQPARKAKKSRSKHARSALTRDQQSEWTQWQQQNLTTPISGELVLMGEQLYARPANLPAMSGARVLRPGLHLGTFKKNRFEPSHSLATALPTAAFKLHQDVDAADFKKYRHGETLSTDLAGKGTILLTSADMPFAIGRLVNGTIKNLYPKGLRV
jgi:NOL1/NOP2/sun family putative RNA methylase